MHSKSGFLAPKSGSSTFSVKSHFWAAFHSKEFNWVGTLTFRKLFFNRNAVRRGVGARDRHAVRRGVGARDRHAVRRGVGARDRHVVRETSVHSIATSFAKRRCTQWTRIKKIQLGGHSRSKAKHYMHGWALYFLLNSFFKRRERRYDAKRGRLKSGLKSSNLGPKVAKMPCKVEIPPFVAPILSGFWGRNHFWGLKNHFLHLFYGNPLFLGRHVRGSAKRGISSGALEKYSLNTRGFSKCENLTRKIVFSACITVHHFWGLKKPTFDFPTFWVEIGVFHQNGGF